MARKGKTNQDKQQQQQQAPRSRVPRKSLPRTKARAEARRKRHERQVQRKQRRLEKRARRLAEELGLDVPEKAEHWGPVARSFQGTRRKRQEARGEPQPASKGQDKGLVQEAGQAAS